MLRGLRFARGVRSFDTFAAEGSSGWFFQVVFGFFLNFVLLGIVGFE